MLDYFNGTVYSFFLVSYTFFCFEFDKRYNQIAKMFTEIGQDSRNISELESRITQLELKQREEHDKLCSELECLKQQREIESKLANKKLEELTCLIAIVKAERDKSSKVLLNKITELERYYTSIVQISSQTLKKEAEDLKLMFQSFDKKLNDCDTKHMKLTQDMKDIKDYSYYSFGEIRKEFKGIHQKIETLISSQTLKKETEDLKLMFPKSSCYTIQLKETIDKRFQLYTVELKKEQHHMKCFNGQYRFNSNHKGYLIFVQYGQSHAVRLGHPHECQHITFNIEIPEIMSYFQKKIFIDEDQNQCIPTVQIKCIEPYEVVTLPYFHHQNVVSSACGPHGGHYFPEYRSTFYFTTFEPMGTVIFG